jgi:hypothetical protein
VEAKRPPEPRYPPDQEIREMGFDPGQLTPDEQQELLELHHRVPDEALSASD